jgi:hypothetical protein
MNSARWKWYVFALPVMLVAYCICVHCSIDPVKEIVYMSRSCKDHWYIDSRDGIALTLSCDDGALTLADENDETIYVSSDCKDGWYINNQDDNKLSLRCDEPGIPDPVEDRPAVDNTADLPAITTVMESNEPDE